MSAPVAAPRSGTGGSGIGGRAPVPEGDADAGRREVRGPGPGGLGGSPPGTDDPGEREGRSRTRIAGGAAAALLVAGLGLRLWHLDAPPYEAHHVRQADTASVARHLERDGLDLLHPRVDWAGGPRAGTAEMEFPVYAGAVAVLTAATDGSYTVARAVGVVAWLAGALALFDLARRRLGVSTAAAGLALWCLSPLSVFYSRAIQPDGPRVAAALVAAAAFDRWAAGWPRRVSGWYAVAALTLAVVLAGGVPGIVSALWIPALAFQHRDRGRPIARSVAVLAPGLVAAGAWAVHARFDLGAGGFTTGVWGAGDTSGPGALLAGWWWRAVGGSAITSALLPAGAALLVAAPFLVSAFRPLLPFGAPIAGFAVLALFQAVSVATHDYTQLVYLPGASVIVGASAVGTASWLGGASSTRTTVVALGISVAAILTSLGPAREYVLAAYAQDARIPFVGERIAAATPDPSALVLCDRHPQSVFHAAERNGWIQDPVQLDEALSLREEGATHLVLTSTCGAFADPGIPIALATRGANLVADGPDARIWKLSP